MRGEDSGDLAETGESVVFCFPQLGILMSSQKNITPIIGIAGIILFILIYAIGNLILHYGQDYLHKPQIEQCELLDKELSKLKVDIDTNKYNIDLNEKNSEAQKIKIDKMENKLKFPDKNYDSEYLYSNDYKRYKKLTDEYNINIVSINQMISNYKSLIEQYNLKVIEYNNLAKTAYSRWYIIPVPGKVSKVRN